MLIAALMSGDLHVSLVARMAMPKDPIGTTYILTFHDVVTGNRYEKSFTGEAEAMYAFAAWIMSDEPESLSRALKALEADPAMKPFLP